MVAAMLCRVRSLSRRWHDASHGSQLPRRVTISPKT